ncbi:5-deoxy-glucuronate isomerase [Hymenobacter qilianensis]|uniref:5-deoxy-glucuronate isomerase n=1 Tax=Hymenobacter qilianensis TaxID=1385715 RepID=UPI00293B9538|nr:5-deoxy-glucuronate isomerase [Hymenobacter qilianensis]
MFSGQEARYYLLSAPAHATHPTTLRTQAEATPVEMGAMETANERTIYKYIYNEGIQSCQLVMGLTQLKPGNVWNTMPAHTHDRRMEAYLYFNLPPNQRVLHLMGEPNQTRPLWVSNEQAIISPLGRCTRAAAPAPMPSFGAWPAKTWNTPTWTLLAFMIYGK